MLKRTSIIIFLFVIAVALFLLYQKLSIPEGLTPLSGQEHTNAKLVFWASIIAFSTSVIGLFQKIIELILKVKQKND